MNIKLSRPLIFFDLETTGLSTSKDRICQLSFTKFYPDRDAETKTKVINPLIPIPEEASKVHGITNEMAQKEHPFSTYAESIASQFEGCDVAGYNILNFDVPLLREEFLRCKIDWPKSDVKFIDVFKLVSLVLPRKLEKIFPILTGIESTESHDAEFDNMMTVEVMDRLLRNEPILMDSLKLIYDKCDTVTALADLCKPEEGRVDFAHKIVIDRAGEYVYNFGKHKGEKVVNYKGFAKWMLTADFTEDTKRCVEQIFKVSKTQLY